MSNHQNSSESHHELFILVIEDDSDLRELIEIVLVRENIKYEISINGKEGIQKFRKSKDSINVVLLDLSLPDYNSKEIFLELLKIKSNVNIIVSTGLSLVRIDPIIRENAKGILNKPYNLFNLVQMINQFISSEKK